jgi:hypothetical protein
MKTILAAWVIMLTLGMGGTGTAGQLGGVVHTTKQVGEVTTDAAKKTGEATKEGAKTAQTAVTGKAHAKCMDGTTQTAKTAKAAASACAKHGGVKK